MSRSRKRSLPLVPITPSRLSPSTSNFSFTVLGSGFFSSWQTTAWVTAGTPCSGKGITTYLLFFQYYIHTFQDQKGDQEVLRRTFISAINIRKHSTWSAHYFAIMNPLSFLKLKANLSKSTHIYTHRHTQTHTHTHTHTHTQTNNSVI